MKARKLKCLRVFLLIFCKIFSSRGNQCGVFTLIQVFNFKMLQWRRKRMKISRFAPIAIVLFAFTLVACANTVRGVGRDVKGTAQAVEDTVKN
ncbi:hypothetical protein [Paenochrobactrum glaciei]